MPTAKMQDVRTEDAEPPGGVALDDSSWRSARHNRGPEQRHEQRHQAVRGDYPPRASGDLDFSSDDGGVSVTSDFRDLQFGNVSSGSSRASSEQERARSEERSLTSTVSTDPALALVEPTLQTYGSQFDEEMRDLDDHHSELGDENDALSQTVEINPATLTIPLPEGPPPPLIDPRVLAYANNHPPRHWGSSGSESPEDIDELWNTIHQNNTDLSLGGVDRIDFGIMNFLRRWHWKDEDSRTGKIRVTTSRVDEWRQQEDVESDPFAPQVDVQDLDWAALETTRTQARKARRILYPHSWFEPASDTADATLQTPNRRPNPLYYNFRRTHPAHRPKMMHWQLRNVLAATSRNSIFYASREKVIRTSLACPTMNETVLDLSKTTPDWHRTTPNIRITTLAVTQPSAPMSSNSDSFLVAGGFGGEYALLNLNSDSDKDLSDATVGLVSHAPDAINTHIHCVRNRRSASPGAVFCSNDCHVRVLDVPTNTFISSHSYQWELNCAATSPDGRLRVLMGDNKRSLITAADTGQILVTLQGHNDDGFACAWSGSDGNSGQSGHLVATGSQDGTVLVWDARNWSQPLQKLGCQLGCPRSLHWTDLASSSDPDVSSETGGNGELGLVVAEADDFVHIYSSSAFGRSDPCSTNATPPPHQTIDFFGAVTGISVLESGCEIIIANGDDAVGGLMVFEQSRFPTNCRRQATTTTTGTSRQEQEEQEFANEAMRDRCRKILDLDIEMDDLDMDVLFKDLERDDVVSRRERLVEGAGRAGRKIKKKRRRGWDLCLLEEVLV